jgi:hypothetical protein
MPPRAVPWTKKGTQQISIHRRANDDPRVWSADEEILLRPA